MKKELFGLLIILLFFFLILPVTAQEITADETCPNPVCVGQAFTCTIDASYTGPGGVYDVDVQRFFDPSVTNVVSSANGHYSSFEDWSYLLVPDGWIMQGGTITMTPTQVGLINNAVIAGVTDPVTNTYTKTSDVRYQIQVNDCSIPGTPTPEFPTMLLPVTIIIGFLGTVLYIRSSREH